MKIIDFYYSIGSCYSYLASAQIRALEQDLNCEILWHPVNSLKLIKTIDFSPFQGEPVSGKYE